MILKLNRRMGKRSCLSQGKESELQRKVGLGHRNWGYVGHISILPCLTSWPLLSCHHSWLLMCR